jgi:hypothetical protein
LRDRDVKTKSELLSLVKDLRETLLATRLMLEHYRKRASVMENYVLSEQGGVLSGGKLDSTLGEEK